MVLLTMQMMLRLLAEMSAWHLQKIFRALRHMTQVIASYTISDSAEAILNAPETSIDKGVTVIDVDGPVEAGVGVQLGEFASGIQAVTGFSSDVQFDVEDSASDIAQALMSDPTDAMNLADSLVATSGVVSVDSAADIQGVTGYDAANSDYAIEDSSGAILASGNYNVVVDSGVEQVFVTDTVSVADGVSLSDMEVALEAERGAETADIAFDVAGSASDIINNASDLSGASIVTVTDGPVIAADGVALNTLEVSLEGDDDADVYTNVEFSVEDSAPAIAAELDGLQGGSIDALDGAESLVVSGGDTTVQGAADIQSLSGIYDASNSAYSITDTAGVILGASETVIDEGVSTINVDGPCWSRSRRTARCIRGCKS